MEFKKKMADNSVLFLSIFIVVLGCAGQYRPMESSYVYIVPWERSLLREAGAQRPPSGLGWRLVAEADLPVLDSVFILFNLPDTNQIDVFSNGEIAYTINSQSEDVQSTCDWLVVLMNNQRYPAKNIVLRFTETRRICSLSIDFRYRYHIISYNAMKDGEIRAVGWDAMPVSFDACFSYRTDSFQKITR
jgi:hypothetical protein